MTAGARLRMTAHLLSDDDAVRDSLGVLLQANDVPVRTYDSPNALIGAVGAKPSGCVLLDVGAKSASPLELSSWLQARGLLLPIIVLAVNLPAIQDKKSDLTPLNQNDIKTLQ